MHKRPFNCKRHSVQRWCEARKRYRGAAHLYIDLHKNKKACFSIFSRLCKKSSTNMNVILLKDGKLLIMSCVVHVCGRGPLKSLWHNTDPAGFLSPGPARLAVLCLFFCSTALFYWRRDHLRANGFT